MFITPKLIKVTPCRKALSALNKPLTNLAKSGLPLPLICVSGTKFSLGFESHLIMNEVWLEKVYDKNGFSTSIPSNLSRRYIIIDAGAHVGIATLYFSRKLREKGLIVAVEPEPANFRMLLWHLALNRVRNVIPINCALGAFNGKAKLYLSPSSTAHSLYKASLRYVEVPVLTVDMLMARLKLNLVDVMKMDVEGAELDILRVTRCLPTKLVIECEPSVRRNLVPLLKRRGYRIVKFFDFGGVLFIYATSCI
jgi:FkbM family methyltransferase